MVIIVPLFLIGDYPLTSTLEMSGGDLDLTNGLRGLAAPRGDLAAGAAALVARMRLSRRASAFLPCGDFWDGTPLGVTALPFRIGRRASRFPVSNLCFRTLASRRATDEDPNSWLSELISSFD